MCAELEGWGCRERQQQGWGTGNMAQTSDSAARTHTYDTIVSWEDICAPKMQQPDSNYAATLWSTEHSLLMHWFPYSACWLFAEGRGDVNWQEVSRWERGRGNGPTSKVLQSVYEDFKQSIWSQECMGTVWSVLACVYVCVFECLSLCVEKSRQGGICLCDVTKREAENLGRVFLQCTDETMTQHDSETADKNMRESVRVCLKELPVKGAESVRFSAHTLADQVSLLENLIGGEERAPQQDTEMEGWKSGCERWVKRPDIKQRFVCFLRLSSPFLLLSRSVSKSTLFPLFMYQFVSGYMPW